MKNILLKQSTKIVNRRTALTNSIGALGILFGARSVFAQENPVCPPPVPVMVKVVESDIAKNHGHEFEIALADLINVGGQTLSIQGESGHPHSIVITNDQIINLMKGGVVELLSSKDAGHTHVVKLLLVERQAAV